MFWAPSCTVADESSLLPDTPLGTREERHRRGRDGGEADPDPADGRVISGTSVRIASTPT